MADRLIPPSLLFRYSVPCRKCEPIWEKTGFQPTAKYALPCFSSLDDRRPFAEVRAGWSDKGLSFWVQVKGKKQSTWCRDTRIDDSDGFQIWIDTRDTHTVHRANRFCHRMLFMPAGSGNRGQQPFSTFMKIHRAKEEPRTFNQVRLPVLSRIQPDGYVMAVHLPSSALNGYDPQQHPRIGFTYIVMDRELGWQTWHVGAEFPVSEDPSLWGTLELAE